MPNIGSQHPLVVHFVMLVLVGVLFRVLSFPLKERAPFLSPAATALILLGTLAAVIGAKSGLDAHGRAEHVPGCADAVLGHEHWGLRARNLLLFVSAFEIVGLFLKWRQHKRAGIPLVLSAVVGLGAATCVFFAGQTGGNVVYSYAGGVGVRGGNNPKDVARLLLAGFYHQAEVLREAGKPAEAYAVTEEMSRRFPDDPEVQLALVESVIVDRSDYGRARVMLDGIDTSHAAPRVAARKEKLKKRIEEGK